MEEAKKEKNRMAIKGVVVVGDVGEKEKKERKKRKWKRKKTCQLNTPGSSGSSLICGASALTSALPTYIYLR